MSRFFLLRGSLALIVLATTVSLLRAQPKAVVPRDQADAAVIKVLTAKTDIDALNLSLEEFAKGLAKRHSISIVLDENGLRRANVARSVPITASFKQVALGTALRLILRPLKLQYRVENGTVIVDDIGLSLEEARRAPPARVFGRRPAIQQFNLRPRVQNAEQIRVPQARMVQLNKANLQATINQLRPLLQVELDYVKRVAPTPEQMRQIKQEGLSELSAAAQQAAGQRVTFQNGRPKFSGESRQVLQEKLAASVRAHLSADQASRYEAEIKKRNANVREACARNLVVILDHELGLSAVQREKLCAELASNWDDTWTQAVVFSSINDQQMIPNIPDDLVFPYLDTPQQTLWNSLPKTGFFNWGVQAGAFLGMNPPMLENDD